MQRPYVVRFPALLPHTSDQHLRPEGAVLHLLLAAVEYMTLVHFCIMQLLGSPIRTQSHRCINERSEESLEAVHMFQRVVLGWEMATCNYRRLACPLCLQSGPEVVHNSGASVYSGCRSEVTDNSELTNLDPGSSRLDPLKYGKWFVSMS